MKPTLIPLGEPLNDGDFPRWAKESIQSIESHLALDTGEVADGFTISGKFTETRILNPESTDISDIANFIATFISDLKNRGSKNDLTQGRGI